MKRTPIRRVSKKKAKINRERSQVFEAAWGPKEWWRCVLRDNPGALADLGPCAGQVNAHEVLKRSQGGSKVNPAGSLPLCNAHNTAVEDFPILARKYGLVLSSREVE